MPDTAVADISFLNLEQGLSAAQEARARGELAGALRIYSALRSAWPDSPLPYLRAASAMVDTANHDEADLLLEAAIERFPSHVGIAADHAWVAHRRHDTAEAIRRWGRLRSRFPDHPVGFTGAASTLRDAARMDEAEALLSVASARFPDDPAPMSELAWFAAAQRDWPLATERWETLRGRFPRLWTGYSGGISALRGARRPQEAEALAREAVALFPNEPMVLIEYAHVAAARQDWPEALVRWERAERKAVGRPEVYSGRALALREQLRFDEADTVLADAMKRFPNAPSLIADYAWIAHARRDWPEATIRWAELRRRFPRQSIGFTNGAVALRETGRIEEAEQLLTLEVQTFPDLLQPLHEMARLAQKRGDWPEAERRWKAIQLRSPDDPSGFHGAAISLREQGRLEEAEALLIEASARFPQHALTLIDLGWLLNRRRDLSGACLVWERVRQAFPGQVTGYTGGAAALRDLHRYDDAATLLRDALERFPGIPEPTTELAWVAQFRGDQATARTLFQQVVERFPSQPVATFGLVQVAMALGRFDEAEALLHAGLAAFPGFRLFTEALETLATRRREWTVRHSTDGRADAGEAAARMPSAEASPGAASAGTLDAALIGAPVASVPDAGGPGLPAPAIGCVAEIKVLFAGFHMSGQIGQLLYRSPLFRDRLSIQRIDPTSSIDGIRGRLPDRWLETADVYFEESMVGDANTRRAIRNALPERCDARSYPTPSMRFLWPFLGPDDRLVAEPPTHNGGRYPNGDRIAARLAGLEGITDDGLFDAYMEQTADAKLDLDADLAADLARWEADDGRHDVKVTPAIRAQFRDQRLFVAPHERAAPVIRAIARQLLETPTLMNAFDLNAMQAAVDHVTRNWSVSRQELPVHPRVAAHFRLGWWSPETRYRILGNRFTFREYIIRYIRWSPWMS